ncbi:MAG: CheY-like chemotaxis protein [Rhodothermales bacterium]
MQTPSTQHLGPSLTELPNTAGKGVYSFGISFGATKFSELDGRDLNNLLVDLSHEELEPDVLNCLAPGFPNPPPPNCYKYIDDIVQLNLNLKIENEFLGYLGSSLQNAGYTVEFAANANDGIRKAQELRPTAILLDIMLPDRDGFEVMKTLKSHDGTKNIPIIVISSMDKSSEQSDGYVDWIIKPIDVRYLMKALGHLIVSPKSH